MTHRRAPSEGLNVGEDFPTTYSTFAVQGNNNSSDGAGDSSSFTPSKRTPGSNSLKQRQSPPVTPTSSKQNTHKKHSSSVSSPLTSSSSPSKLTFSTQDAWRGSVNGVKEYWKVIILFLVISAIFFLSLPLMSIDNLIASRQQQANTIARGKLANRNILDRPVRSVREAVVPEPAAAAVAELQAAIKRSSDWAESVTGPADEEPIPDSDGSEFDNVAEEDMIEDGDFKLASSSEDPEAATVLAVQRAMAERRAARWAARWANTKRQKRRTDDSPADLAEDDLLDVQVHEHPSRKARKSKLVVAIPSEKAPTKTEEGVFQRFAKAFRAVGSNTAAGSPALTHPTPWGAQEASGHILGTWGASHPELIDVDGGYAGM